MHSTERTQKDQFRKSARMTLRVRLTSIMECMGLFLDQRAAHIFLTRPQSTQLAYEDRELR